MKGIYAIKEKDGTPVYVGKSVNIYARWGAHQENYPYEKYDFEVLELTNELKREQYWIDHMNTLLEGNNKINAVKTVETRARYKTDIPHTTYKKNRMIALLKTFEGEGCTFCGETTDRYLYWFPWHKLISQGFLRYGKNTKERTIAIEYIDKSKPLCLNCGADKIWGEEKAPG